MKKNWQKKIKYFNLFLAILAIFLLILSVVYNKKADISKETQEEVVKIENNNFSKLNLINEAAEKSLEIEKKATLQKPANESKSTEMVKITEKVLLDVPFSSQAPFGNWHEPFNEACEEASIVMAAYWLENKLLTEEIAKQEILALVDYEKKNHEIYNIDITASETVKLANDFYQINNFKVVDNITINDIISELSQGNLVIVPVAGRLLTNPYFRHPGPLYHMLLIIGYDKNAGQFITNDAGTKRGKGFRYNFSNLEKSLADWNKEKKEPDSAHKTMVVISVNTQ